MVYAPPTKMQLNDSQKEAVHHDLGPLLVLAGAGSGKTRVVTNRIARLIERGVPSRSILAMTFTNKAAAEMHERVGKLVGNKVAKDLTISTFHSFGLKVIKADAAAFGLRNGSFVIFDQSDVVGLIRELLRNIEAGRRYDMGAILARISKAKNEFVEPDDYVESEGDEYDEITRMIYPRYIAALRNFSAFDFDDLVCEPVRLWQSRPDILEKWQTRYRYLMVDEYQDTNHAQFEMVRLLGGEHRNVCVVGDDDQSIYAWRGADVKNILDFEDHFPGAKVVKLEDNYRSTDAILSVANAVLAKSQGRRHEKTLRAARKGGEKVELIHAADPETEAHFVTEQIRALRDKGVPFHEIAILYRAVVQSEPIEAALREGMIPFRMVGGTQFYDRKEVKDLIAYLKVALHPRDEVSLRRIINYPARGIGEAAIERLVVAATARGLSLWDAVERAYAIEGLSAPAIDGCRNLSAIIAEARRMLDTGSGAAEVARRVAEAIGLREDLHAAAPSNEIAQRRWGNIESLFAIFSRHEGRHGGPNRERLAELLRVLSLAPEAEQEEDKSRAVTLTTMHAAKGLEYRVVFLIGLEDGIIPHQRTLDPRATDISGQRDDIEEERRLFYVSVTRARDKLYLSRTKFRMMRGKPTPRIPSRFVMDIPEELLEAREVNAKIAPSAARTAKNAAAAMAMFEKLISDEAGAAAPIRRPRG